MSTTLSPQHPSLFHFDRAILLRQNGYEGQERTHPSIFDIRYSAVLRFAFPWFCGSLFNLPRASLFNFTRLHPAFSHRLHCM